MATTTERTIDYLLVDDSDEHADIVRRCIGHARLPGQIHRVSSGADCLSYLSGDEPFSDRDRYPYPDVVLLDIRMPGVLDGLQTLQSLRSDTRHRSLVIVMLTTSDRDSDVNRAYELGANGYIVKSDDTAEMIAKLQHLQESHSSLVQLPRRSSQSDPVSEQEQASPTPGSQDVEFLLQLDQDAAIDFLLSGYRNDRDEILRLLTFLEKVSPTRFAKLGQRFCVEGRRLFAGGEDVDWAFLRNVVMETLPQHVPPEKMAGVLAGIRAALEDNASVDRHSSSWHAWQGFCRAYANQTHCLSSAPMEQDEVDLPRSPSRWKAVAGVVLLALVGLVAYWLGNAGY